VIISPRIIHILLYVTARRTGCMPAISGNWSRIRSFADAKIRSADRLEWEAGNAIMWAGGPAVPSPSGRQAEPTIGKAIKRRLRPARRAVQSLRARVSRGVARPEAAAGALPAWFATERGFEFPDRWSYSRRHRAYILGPTYARPDDSSPREAGGKP
jgi:hypothetical protein